MPGLVHRRAVNPHLACHDQGLGLMPAGDHPPGEQEFIQTYFFGGHGGCRLSHPGMNVKQMTSAR